MRAVDLNVMLDAALIAAKKASEAVLEVYQGEFAVDSKQDRSPITEADRSSHRIIVRELSRYKGKKEEGSIPILSEEGAGVAYSERKRWNAFWMIDPLDGTKEFIKRNGEFTINIALIKESKPVLGVVCAPVLDCLYFGHIGIGSFKLSGFVSAFDRMEEANGSKVCERIITCAHKLEEKPPRKSSRTGKTSKITVMGSRSHRSQEFEDFIQRLKQEHRDVDLITIGSALKICFVAEGKADIYPRFGPTMEWDTAAAHMIANSVGKKLCTFTKFQAGEELVYNKEDLANSWFIVQ